MNRILMLVVISMLSISCNAKEISDKIEIDNVVSKCIVFNKDSTETYGNLILLNTSWLVSSNIGSCGCKSAALKYRVVMDNSKIISSGMFSTLDRSSFKFVITSDKNLYKISNYNLVIDCN